MFCDDLGMMTSFLRPVMSGSCFIFSGSAPATQAAVAWLSAAAAPDVTIAHSTPSNWASRFPAASMSWSRLT